MTTERDTSPDVPDTSPHDDDVGEAPNEAHPTVREEIPAEPKED